MLKSPLLWLVVTGTCIFLVDLLLSKEHQGDLRIDVTDIQVQRLGELWRAQTGAPPSPQQMRGLIEDWIKEEIFYREALRLRLDEDDTIVRRRLVQKLNFLTEDTANNEIPDYRSKLAYYQSHIEDYRIPPAYSFSHIYFNASKPDSASKVSQVLDALSRGESWRELGDPFMLNLSYAERPYTEIVSLFGRAFAGAVRSLALNEWTGPVPSAYGLHIVRLEARKDAVVQDYETVQDQVRDDYIQSRLEASQKAYYEKLRSKYQINYRMPKAAPP